MKTLLFLMAAGLCFAQTDDRPHTKYYRLDFVVKELDAGKLQSSKNYSVIGSITGGGSSMIRSSDKVPVVSGGGGGNQQYTYIDVGVNIDCKLQFETPTDLSLQISADITSAAGGSQSPIPAVDQTRWNSNVVVPLKKATTIFSSESPSSKRTTQLELTATPLP